MTGKQQAYKQIKAAPALRRAAFNLNLITIKPVSVPVRVWLYNYYTKNLKLRKFFNEVVLKPFLAVKTDI